jgi:hypothetical protein
MSMNPDVPSSANSPDAENSTHEIIINNLQEENENLRIQIEDLTRRLTEYEVGAGSRDEGQGAATRARVGMSSRNSSRGRRSIPFAQRNEKQHQGRMAYLFKLLEKRSEQKWNQDLIADIQEYCVSYSDFLEQALRVYGCDEAVDIDTFLAMLQSHL